MMTLGRLLRASKLAQMAELMAVFFGAFAVITIATPFVGENPLMRQAVVWVANVLMLGIVWLGLRLRGLVRVPVKPDISGGRRFRRRPRIGFQSPW